MILLRENECRVGRQYSERGLVEASREGGRVELRSPHGAARASGASWRRPAKVGGWSYARLAGQRERAKPPPRGVPGRRAGGVTLETLGRASDRSLVAASREGGRGELRSPGRAARRRAGRWRAKFPGERGQAPFPQASPAFSPCPSADRVESRAVPREGWVVYEL